MDMMALQGRCRQHCIHGVYKQDDRNSGFSHFQLYDEWI